LALPKWYVLPSSFVTDPVIEAFTVLMTHFLSRAATSGVFLGFCTLIEPKLVNRPARFGVEAIIGHFPSSLSFQFQVVLQ
jgi:hypothetical protein